MEMRRRGFLRKGGAAGLSFLGLLLGLHSLRTVVPPRRAAQARRYPGPVRRLRKESILRPSRWIG